MMEEEKIRVLVAGDRRVGKTSLVLSMVGKEMPRDLPAQVGPQVISPEVMRSHLATEIIDSIADPSELQDLVRSSSVVVLVYDITREETIEGLHTQWLPMIQSVSKEVPVIIIANKIDLLDTLEEEDRVDRHRIQRVLRRLLRDFPQVEMGLECAAARNKNIPAILFCAQRVVLHPLGPLYKTNERELTEPFKRALKRIFRICDKDGNGPVSYTHLTLPTIYSV
eukprot:TRINITY_DN15438_c0_g1_i1.p1 TRINITY_DN15438_c0_g1~~TRINITY_DN15438_c0_g1_i1.p1  ORF type:complete len:224 (-),score=40.61 TRINITY_DN15438_c0_g1_i1:38-709(-)